MGLGRKAPPTLYKTHASTSTRTKEKRQTHAGIWMLLKKMSADVRADEERKPTRLYISRPKSASTHMWVLIQNTANLVMRINTCV